VAESDPGEATGLIRAASADGGGGRGETGGFVGRERELARLIDALADLSDGPHVVLVLGEAGIGKTRLVDEFSAAARASATIFRGTCDARTMRAFQPFAEALLRYARDTGSEECRRDLGPLAVRLGPLVPEWADPSATRDDTYSSRMQASEQDDARLELFDAIIEFFVRQCATQSCVLVLEDIHWASLASLRMLRHLAGAPAEFPLLIVTTCRNLDAVSDEALDCVTDLMREPRTLRIELSGLEEEALASLAAELRMPDPENAAKLLRARTNGNALFATHLLAHAQMGGELTEVPSTVRNLISQRIAQLDEPTVEVLRIASVIGSPFSYRVLAAAAMVDENVLMTAVEHAQTKGFIVEANDPDTVYSFAHELIRDVLDTGVSKRWRSRLHGIIADAIDSCAASGDAATRLTLLAYHWSMTDSA